MRFRQKKREGATMQTLRVAIIAILLRAALAALSLPGCPETCGNISIPYPFGIGPGCFREGFNLTCSNSSNPPKLSLGDGTIQVLSISLPEGAVRINSNKRTFFDSFDTQSPASWTGLMDNGPYTLSVTRNRFVAVGCSVLASILDPRDHQSITCFCGSMCMNDPTNYGIDGGACSGITCCQTSISRGMKNFNVQLQSFNQSTPVWAIGTLSKAFVLEHNSYQFSPGDLWSSRHDWESRVIPAVLDWIMNDIGSCENSKNLSSFACRSLNSECYNSTDRTGYRCNCSQGFQGNPYLSGGCKGNFETVTPTEEGGEAELESVAKLAEMCLRLKGEERPTMKEVEVRLEALRGLKKQPQHIRDAERRAYLADSPMTRQRSSGTATSFSLEKEFLESVNFPR